MTLPSYDIVIVGGRVAGSATAISLARSGYSVLLLERDRMPSDTLSTHVIWPDGLAALDRLGLLEHVLATGAPLAHHFRLCRGVESIETALIPYDDAGRFDALLCVRRHLLDGILWDAAASTPGVEVRDRTTARRLRWEGKRVVGVEISGPAGDETVDASLVVGADGRGSLVARQVGAVERDIVPAGRYWYYGYFEGARLPDPPALLESDTETDTVVAMATNDGLLMVILGAYNEDFDVFRKDHHANYLAGVDAHACIAERLDGASLAEPVRGIAGVRGYYRQAWGSGWALVGDAAHQMDPLVARGVSEALRGAEWLAGALSGGATDDALASYEATLRERTWSKALNARMLSRPDQHMTAEQAAKLSAETVTPEGLAGYLLLEYSDDLTFDEYFS
ncbi:MAG TPA: NAD(P)/FAD-dependent oxidoreductase [Thermomicrobiales bacterium]|nr:NAD(P)/FAD-dependent oxidoreductase [Thermomicrobiales bacterium]